MHAKEKKENNVGKIKIVLGWALPQCLRIPFKESEQPQFGLYVLVGLCFLVKTNKNKQDGETKNKTTNK